MGGGREGTSASEMVLPALLCARRRASSAQQAVGVPMRYPSSPSKRRNFGVTKSQDVSREIVLPPPYGEVGMNEIMDVPVR